MDPQDPICHSLLIIMLNAKKVMIGKSFGPCQSENSTRHRLTRFDTFASVLAHLSQGTARMDVLY